MKKMSLLEYLLHAPGHCYMHVYGHDTSNAVESFNQWIASERQKSQLEILIGITLKTMEMFHERRKNVWKVIACTARRQSCIYIMESNSIKARYLKILSSSDHDFVFSVYSSQNMKNYIQFL